MGFKSIQEIKDRCISQNIPFWKCIQLADCEERAVLVEDSWDQMVKTWHSLKESIDAYDPELLSTSGLVGREGGKMESYSKNAEPICGNFVAKVMTAALKMGCNNACMKRIVAAPTAGACGVMPAVLVTFCEEKNIPEEKMVEAMYVAAGIGQVIAARASIAGASGGCQAEIGSAAAMSAAALCYVNDGNLDQIGHACAMAIKNMLGLVCDPVGGLVEVPCVKRNVAGALNALSATDMALAGIESQIPVDEVIDAMREVGDKMDVSLKETGIGGVAGSPTAQEIMKGLKF
ncbi:MAG: L-serine ammonia-lyase, iron-sulfur-dependent, subunit alpha [Eubacteriales bacterium]|nr:L-serine ammonia-lyase, iron-sulfur-dependent, subunit alpha [Eubacteriales bacterium]